MNKTTEEIFIEYLSPSLPLFEKKTVAYRFQCPYCQSSGKGSKGKPLSPSGARGYLYPVGNAWNFKCHKCGEHKSFEKFLKAQFPLLHFEYVRLRDQLGTTGFQTNCPSLETLLKKRGVLGNPPEFRPEHFHHQVQRPVVPPSMPSAPHVPKVTKLPPMRSQQQQAGHQSGLNHLMKQRQKRRRDREGW
jgi:hypothetical protein